MRGNEIRAKRVARGAARGPARGGRPPSRAKTKKKGKGREPACRARVPARRLGGLGGKDGPGLLRALKFKGEFRKKKMPLAAQVEFFCSSGYLRQKSRFSA